MRTMKARLRFYRRMRDMTQRQIAEQLGISQPTVVNWEKGVCEPSASQMLQLHKILRVPVEYLLGMKKDPAFVAYLKRAPTRQTDKATTPQPV